MYRLINALGFQLGWFVCITAVRLNLEIPALIFCSVLVYVHLCYSTVRKHDLVLSVIGLGLGIVIDTSLQYFSVVYFYGWSVGALSPFWLWMVWIMFALTLNTSLSFLKQKHLLLSAFVGFVFGPLSYLAGVKLGAAKFGNVILPTAILAFVWMITLPLLVFISKTSFATTEVTHDAP